MGSLGKGGWKMAKGQTSKKEKLGVKIVVEITGHMQRAEVNQFMASLSSVVNNHVENGGNGGS
jgi:predicted metal-dependent peptidase